MATWQAFIQYDWFSIGQHSWADDLTGGPGDAVFNPGQSNGSRLVYTHSDHGTKTFINGTGLAVDAGGAISWTSLSSVEHIAPDGSTVIERINAFAPAIAGTNSVAGTRDFFAFILSGDDTLIGSSGRDHLVGGDGVDVFFASPGVDALVSGDSNGSTGTNLFRVQNAADFEPGDVFSGRAGISAGTSTLQLEFNGTFDLTGAGGRSQFLSVNAVKFAQTFGLVLFWDASDLSPGTGKVQTFIGGAGVDSIVIRDVVDVSHLTFSDWTAGQDTIVLNVGGSGQRTGTNQGDRFLGLSNMDGLVRGLDGDDTFAFGGFGDLSAGLAFDGGNGIDTLEFFAATFDFSGLGTHVAASIERIVFAGGLPWVTFRGDQIAASSLTDVIGGSFQDTLIVTGTANLSALNFSSWASDDRVWMRGSEGADTLTGSAVGDAINAGNGSDTLTGGGGNDVMLGGSGLDTAVFSGARSSYEVTRHANYQLRVADLRPGAPDGTDLVSMDIENFQFSDGTRVLKLEQFQPHSLGLAAFGRGSGAGGWTSDDTYPRHLADVTGDGAPDIVGFGGGGVFVSINDGHGNFGAHTVGLGQFGQAAGYGGWTSDNIYHRELGDVTGDGRADIVGFGGGGVFVSVNDGSGNFAAHTVTLGQFGQAAGYGGWSSQDRYPRHLADVNGDGMDDIVGFGEAGVYVSLATGGGNFAPHALTLFGQFGAAASAGGWGSDGTYHRELADLNNDNMADIIGFREEGVFVALASGGGNFAPSTFALGAFGRSAAAGGWTSQDRHPRHAADVNGDGYADIVGFHEGGVYRAMGMGDGSFIAIGLPDVDAFGAGPGAGGWMSDDVYPRHLADINNDGSTDIVGFGDAGVYVSPANQFLLI